MCPKNRISKKKFLMRFHVICRPHAERRAECEEMSDSLGVLEQTERKLFSFLVISKLLISPGYDSLDREEQQIEFEM